MANFKLTKNGLRDEQKRLTQLLRYLPTLKLKKALLQIEVNEARQEVAIKTEAYEKEEKGAEGFAALLAEKTVIDPTAAIKVLNVQKRYENIAGIEVPYFEGATFQEVQYALIDTPAWIDGVVIGLQKLAALLVEIHVLKEKQDALEKELRSVSIRVNLFEKILIPRAERNIRKIRVFLGDQQLSAVGQMKVAKAKIEEKKLLKVGAL